MIICDECGLVIDKKSFCSTNCRVKNFNKNKLTPALNNKEELTQSLKDEEELTPALKKQVINKPSDVGDFKKWKSFCKKHKRAYNANKGEYECGCK